MKNLQKGIEEAIAAQNDQGRIEGTKVHEMLAEKNLLLRQLILPGYTNKIVLVLEPNGLEREALRKRIQEIITAHKEIDEISIRGILAGEGFNLHQIVSCGDADIFDNAIDVLLAKKIIHISKWKTLQTAGEIREFRKSDVPIFSLTSCS